MTIDDACKTVHRWSPRSRRSCAAEAKASRLSLDTLSTACC